MQDQTFKIRDLRKKGYFVVDDEYLNGYAKRLDPHATCVYLSLCRHADKSQKSFPSMSKIAEQHNISRRTVIRKIELLQKYGLIRVQKSKDRAGKYERNTYFLMDKSKWLHVTQSHTVHVTQSHRGGDTESQGVVTQSHTKDTHREGNTEKEREPQKNTISYLENIPKEDLREFLEKFNCDVEDLKDKGSALADYCRAKNKRYADYKAFLRNALRRDFGKRKASEPGKGDVVW